MKLGAEPKKLAALGGLVLIAGAVYIYNSGDSNSPAPAGRRPAVTGGNGGPASSPSPTDASGRGGRTRPSAQSGNGEFKPSIGPKRGQTRPDPATIEPTLRLDLLAKVQKVEPESSLRNLFQFGPAAPKPLPDNMKNVPKIPVNKPPVIVTQAPPPSGPPQSPPPPPMTFKYYGYKLSKLSGVRQAFILDGDDIIVVSENELFKKRYKVIKIGNNSVTIEDTQFKHSQTLPLQEDAIA